MEMRVLAFHVFDSTFSGVDQGLTKGLLIPLPFILPNILLKGITNPLHVMAFAAKMP